jgi:ferredoxin
MKEFRHLDDVSTLVLDRDKCIGCGLCTEVCPHAVFEMEQKKAHIVDFNACMECGACVNNCPSGAISVNPGVG